MSEREVAPHEWGEFSRAFTEQHLGWLSTIETVEAGKRRTIATGEPFRAITLDENGALLAVGKSGAGELVHRIEGPRAIRLERTGDGSHSGLTIESRAETVRLRFRAAAHPEALDGWVPPRA